MFCGTLTSCLVQVECHVLSTEGAERQQDDEVIAPLSVDGGGWDEVVNTAWSWRFGTRYNGRSPRRDGNRFRIRIHIRSDGRL